MLAPIRTELALVYAVVRLSRLITVVSVRLPKAVTAKTEESEKCSFRSFFVHRNLIREMIEDGMQFSMLRAKMGTWVLQWRGSSYSPAMTARQAFYRTSSTVRFYLLRFYASEVLLALEYLHMMGVVYRDLKPENVLSCSEPSCRITSYCIQPACIDPACKLPVCVEPACLQPSCFKARFLSTKTSKGDDNRETLFNVVGQSLKFMDGSSISFAAKDLIRGLLVKDPQKRLGFKRGATEIKQHPFFESVNWALIRSTHPPEIPKPIDIPLLNQAFKSSARPNDKGATDSNRSSGLYLDFEFF
ncbi:hypothetical protein V6N11_069924 [Hibiscus sabdariffa]|uniref:non-specific serine/threonine protein kinase n=1 Tax=Hibiscus sabdariffa TaxID=183260 RepID=A0ABR2NH84_9ROSI